MLQCPVGTVWSRLERARSKLRDLLGYSQGTIGNKGRNDAKDTQREVEQPGC